MYTVLFNGVILEIIFVLNLVLACSKNTTEK